MSSDTPKKNYLKNKDLLREIHKSKMSYCYLEDARYDQFDYILFDDDKTENELLALIDDNLIQQAKQNRASRQQTIAYTAAVTEFQEDDEQSKKPRQKEFAVNTDDICTEDLVFRVMTFKHVPDTPGRKKTVKRTADLKERINFPPFKHYVIRDGKPVEVGRSHWNGDLDTGHFDTEHGAITHKLATMYVKLVERVGYKSNWRRYTYLDEMRGQALIQLSYVGLMFNEAKSDNPFSYYTATVNNSFTKILNMEKRQQNIRDDLLVEQGLLPSFSRQIDHENQLKAEREEQAFDDQSSE